MQIYTVGGAVRDGLLGLPVKDRDYVVVGATPEQMLALGYRPVGKDFPVFLHPATHEEYALARTERKTAPGYSGFAFHAAPDVTLEQDLVRRDLTINAMARDTGGVLIDPFGGQADLQARLFRHVSAAFAEDPVRILRTARFAARFTAFGIAPETMALMRDMVAAGEVDALVPERVWQELARGLMERQPSRMIDVLHACGALARLLPEFDALLRAPAPVRLPVMRAIDLASQRGYALPLRFALLGLSGGEAAGESPSAAANETSAAIVLAHALCARLRVPNLCRELALMSARERPAAAQAQGLSAEALVSMLSRCDAWRKPERFIAMLQVLDCAARAAEDDGKKGVIDRMGDDGEVVSLAGIGSEAGNRPGVAPEIDKNTARKVGKETGPNVRVERSAVEIAVQSAIKRAGNGDVAVSQRGSVPDGSSDPAAAVASVLQSLPAPEPEDGLDGPCVKESEHGLHWPPARFLTAVLSAAQAVDAGAVAAMYRHAPQQIAAAIHAARVGAVVQLCETAAVVETVETPGSK